MRRIISIATTIAFSLCITSCGGGGSSGSNAAQVRSLLDQAQTSLAGGKIRDAKAIYDHILGAPASVSLSKALDASNAEASFGRALCNLLLLPETNQAAAILEKMGTSPWDVEATVFSPETGFLAKSWNNGSPLDSSEGLFTDMPFVASGEECRVGNLQGTGWRGGVRCSLSKVEEGYTGDNLAADVLLLMNAVDAIISDLETAVTDNGIAFTIPKGLYTGDADIVVGRADMFQMLASLYMVKFGADIANSYVFTLDLSRLVAPDGQGLVTRCEIANELNQQFALRSDNLFSSARTNLFQALRYAQQSFDIIIQGNQIGILKYSAENAPIYADISESATQALASFEGSQLLGGILPTVSGNAQALFDNPPNGADIESTPFWCGVDGQSIRAVESYWQQMIAQATSYDLNDRNVQAFSTATKAVQRPFFQMFSAIMERRFGKWYAGAGPAQ